MEELAASTLSVLDVEILSLLILQLVYFSTTEELKLVFSSID